MDGAWRYAQALPERFSSGSSTLIPNLPDSSFRPLVVTASARLSRSWITHLRLMTACSTAAPSAPAR